jgi:hypothetical protein
VQKCKKISKKIIWTIGILSSVTVLSVFWWQSRPTTSRGPASVHYSTQICHVRDSYCRMDYECCSFTCREGQCIDPIDKIDRKKYIGEETSSPADCLSGYARKGICMATYTFKAKTFQYCEEDSDCESGNCSKVQNLCLGATYGRDHKATYGQYCTTSSQCLSGSCHPDFEICLGGPKDPAFKGEFCGSKITVYANKQCQSEICDLKSNKCK